MGVRELKSRLSEFLRRVTHGERVTVTDRGQPIAVIGPPESAEGLDDIVAMVREGRAAWSGGKPRGAARRIRVRGKPLSETVLEDRR